MVGFDVREVNLKDYEDIYKLNSKLNYSNIKSISEDNKSLMIVAQLNDDVIGYINSNFNEDSNNNKTINIKDIIVDEKYRGLGVGHQLMLEVEKNAKDNRVNYIVSINKDYHKEEIEFYNRQGFELDKDFKFVKKSYLQ
ncbi:GNAT family N-acetyltransferase [Clostridium sartagoforme]|jgi:ribosomal protein S18 acetylase RimI-like enzyme|uniref:GNAT family N-acetyltransferase n=1 Tax=Clostridium sartagoforme TaxID=84031 RepID=UPI0031DBB8F0